MRRLVALALVLAALVGTSCGATRRRPERELDTFLSATEKASKTFVYTEKSNGVTAVATGTIEDDLRFAGSLTLQGVPVEEIVATDDSLAVRFYDQARAPEPSSYDPADKQATDALAAGKWVIDYAAAPPLLAPRTREGAVAVGENPLLDAAYAFQYFRRAIADGIAVREFNPDDIQYNPADDPFAKPNKALGVKRYDIVPPPLPRRSQRGASTSTLPTPASFRKISFYIRDGKVIRVEEHIDVETQRDFRRAKLTGGPKFVLGLLEGVRQGKTREPLRLRRLSFVVSDIGSPATVQLPLEDAVTGSLKMILGPQRTIALRGLVGLPAAGVVPGPGQE